MPVKRFSQAVAVRMASEEDDSDENECPPTPGNQSVAAVGSVTLLLVENSVKVGTLLNGKIIIERGLPPISKVRVSIRGVSLAQFCADDGKEYKAKQEFLNEVVDLMGGVEQVMQAPSEEIVIPFQYRIPSNVPPSFNGNYGGISYECAANLKFKSASGLARKRVRRVPFHVLPKIDKGTSVPASPAPEGKEIARSRSTSGPCSYFHTHRMKSFGSTDGTVEIALWADRTTLKRGQSKMRVILDVTNKTRLILRDLKFGILMTTQWNAKGRKLTEKKRVVEECKDDFALHPSKSIRLEKLFPPIPAESPPTIEPITGIEEGEISDFAQICRCAYVLFVKMVPPTFAKICLYEVPLKVY